MQNIVCPSCGSEKITPLKNGKAVCEACDSVFNIHDYSKEFEKTSSHIDAKSKEIIENIEELKKGQSLANQDIQRYEKLLEDTQEYFNLRDRQKALDSATEAIKIFPGKARGYVILYRVWTDAYRETTSYDVMLNTKESVQASKILDVAKKALRCSDCPNSFKEEITSFMKECAVCAVTNLEAESVDKEKHFSEEAKKKETEYQNTLSEMQSQKEKLKEVKKRTYIKYCTLAVAVLILGLALDITEWFTIIAAISCLGYVVYVGSNKIINHETDDNKKAVFIMILLVIALPGILLKFASTLGTIVDLLCLVGGLFILIIHAKKQTDLEESELNEKMENTLPELEKQWEESKAIASKEMKRLREETALYKQILTDAERDDKGVSLINNYLNSRYLHK